MQYTFRHLAGLFILMLFTNTLSAQEDINKLNQEGRKHGPWKGFYEESKRLRYEGVFENGKEVGTFKYYDDTKLATVVATRVFSPKDGSAFTTFFNQKGNKISEGKTVNKLHEGEWIYYHQNTNNIMTRETYKAGKLHGLRSVYFPNGKIAEEIHFKDGIRHGNYRKYTPTGVVLEETTYKNGEIDGYALFRGSDGKIASEGKFVNGLKKGKWKFYEGGKLIREEKHPLVRKFKKSPAKTE
ncbi:MAG: toxin-antitoxin system YwqK family antitoxin [Flavobacterium sp.]|nr:toxin-antitoxin system YwqK family antitoxin [Flavobacterium sp.]